MNKSDFYIGQKVVVVKNFARTKERSFENWEIIKIGRLYVTARKIGIDKEYSDFYTRQFSIKEGFDKDSTDYKMYLTKQSVADEDEKYSLLYWLNEVGNKCLGNRDKYTLEALRQVKEILENCNKL